MSFASTVKRAWQRNQLVSALVELTYACNLNCEFCYNDLSLEGRPLTVEQYQRFFEDLAALGTLNLTLSGGEPLAHPNFYEIGAAAKRLGFVVRIKSNGHAIKPHVAERIRSEIDPFLIEVSLHGARAQTHDRQTRVAGSFDRLLNNIGAMRAAALRVKVNSVLTRWNEDEIEDMIDLCEALDVTLQVDTDVKPRDDGDTTPLALAPSEAGIRRYESAVYEQSGGGDSTDSRVDMQLAALRASKRSGDKHCGAGSSGIAVDPFGNVLPCVQWRVPAGNLHDSSMLDIWKHSTVLNEVRDTTRHVSAWLEEQGETAALSNYCPGAAHTYSGDPFYLYPSAEARMTRAARDRVHLPVL